MKTTDFIVENIGEDADAMHKDHEVQMARQDCYNAAKNAIDLHKLLADVSEMEGLEGWVSEKITLAADYLKTVKEHFEYEQMSQQQSLLPEFTFESAETQYNETLEQGVSEGKVGADPYDRGYNDGQRMGSNSYHNPYSREDEPTEWDEYKSGFNMAQIELQNDLEDNGFSEGVAEGSLNEFAPVSGPGGDNYEDDLHDILMVYIMRNEPGLINHFGKDEVDGVVANMVTMGTFASIDPNNKEDLADALDKIIDILNDDLPDPQGVAEGKKRVSEMTAGGTGAGGFATGPTAGKINKPGTGVPKKVGNIMKRVAPKIGKGIY